MRDQARAISTTKPDNAPYIPCHNFATAVYYKNNTDDGDIWEMEETNEKRAPYYVVIPN